ncbi:MAG TPA: winged helix-turn-helix domain-containing protein [Tahibacter sp.]|nr:winged helix-turn-helix domain-containing protein [Tahibacter sp.]
MSEATGQPWPENTHRLRLGEVEFDLRYRSVHRNGRVHELNQRCFDLLLLFLREPHLLHTREEIFRRVWSGAVVEDANITTSIWMLRKALGDEAKGWIRTVSKQGYVFDPPGAIEPAPIEPAPANDVAAPEPVAAPPPPLQAEPVAAEPTPSAAPLRRHSAAAVAALLLVGALLVAAFAWPMELPSPRRVVLVAVPDTSLQSEARWPAELLYGWIEWQLAARSDRVVLADASTERDGNDVVVLLSVAMPVGRDSEWHVRAHLHDSSGDASFDRGSTPERLVGAIDEVGREVVRHFAPDMDDAQPPSLGTLEPAVAPDLVKAIAAAQRDRWSEAAALYRRVLEAAPEFGFARLRLAAALAELGQSNAAQAELALAERWVARLPAALQPLPQAQMLAIRQDYCAAAQQFGELWTKSRATRSDLRLAEAVNLRRAGRSRDAQERLSGVLPAAPAQALPWLVERAEAELANLDLAHARATAAEAIKLARALDWDHDRARAVLLLIDAMSWSELPIEDALYDDAIAGFGESGDRLGLRRARVLHELRDDSGADADGAIAELDELLAEARAAGNAAIEVDALRRVGLRELRRGDVRAAQQRFKQAEAVAESAGDHSLEREVDADLLRLDSWGGDFTAVEGRLATLRAAPLQGRTAFFVGMAAARLQLRRGQYDAALSTVDAAEEQLRANETRSLPPIAAGLACTRAAVLIRQGRTADANTAINACNTPQLPFYAGRAGVLEARLSVLAGDEATSRSRLHALQGSDLLQPASQVEGWLLEAELAPLLARIGETQRAAALVDALIPAVAASGLAAIEADVRLVAAELALSRGELAAAQAQLSRVDALVQADDWDAREYLQRLQVLLLRAQGQETAAWQRLAALHEAARTHGDVPAELQLHSLAGAQLVELCPAERHERLLAQSGMRGVAQPWPASVPVVGNGPAPASLGGAPAGLRARAIGLR